MRYRGAREPHIGRESWTAASHCLAEQSEVEGVLRSVLEILEAQGPAVPKQWPAG